MVLVNGFLCGPEYQCRDRLHAATMLSKPMQLVANIGIEIPQHSAAKAKRGNCEGNRNEQKPKKWLFMRVLGCSSESAIATELVFAVFLCVCCMYVQYRLHYTA